MRYVRDVPADDPSAVDAEKAHVVAYLSAATTGDDDQHARAHDVSVFVERHPDDPALLRIVGEIDADPAAPYLTPGHDPWSGVDPALRQEVLGDGTN